MPDRWGTQMAAEPLVLRTAIGKYPTHGGAEEWADFVQPCYA